MKGWKFIQNMAEVCEVFLGLKPTYLQWSEKMTTETRRPLTRLRVRDLTANLEKVLVNLKTMPADEMANIDLAPDGLEVSQCETEVLCQIWLSPGRVEALAQQLVSALNNDNYSEVKQVMLRINRVSRPKKYGSEFIFETETSGIAKQ